MKSYVAVAATVAAFALALESASAMQAYLDYIPNGSLFSQELGHPDNDSSQYTDFATDFLAANLEWTTDFCQATFPSSSMTNGQAFGDPCCTWAEGGTPDFTVTPFTTTPTEATTCATSSSTTSSTTSSTASSTASSSTGSASTSTTSTAASTTSSSTGSSTAASTASSSTTDESTTDESTTSTTTTTSTTGSSNGQGGKGQGKSGCKARRN